MTQRVTPKIDYEHPHRPAPLKKKAAKPEPFWSPKKWKLYLLAGWVACTAFWIPVAAQRSHMDFVYERYSAYWHYEQQVQSGRNRDYARRGYRKAVAALDETDQYVIQFTVTAIVWPMLILMGGAWLLRNAK